MFDIRRVGILLGLADIDQFVSWYRGETTH